MCNLDETLKYIPCSQPTMNIYVTAGYILILFTFYSLFLFYLSVK